MDKATLRTIYLEKRKKLSTAVIRKYDAAIFKNFFTIQFLNIKFIHLFYPISSKKEPDTLRIASWLQNMNPNSHLVLPKIDNTSQSLKNVIWNSKTALIRGPWGILEPIEGQLVKPKQIDLFLIPLLAYDRKGYRVGYGKGFYDRLLSQCRPDALKIGLSMFEPVEQIVDVDIYDICLDFCITPNSVWDFRNHASTFYH